MAEENDKLPVQQEEDKPYKYAVSTTTKTAEEFRELAESVGLNQGELFSGMIRMYKASNAANGVNKAKEIQDLGRHLNRVEEIFVALVNELGDYKEQAQREIQTLTLENAEKLRVKGEEIDELKMNLQTMKEMYREQTDRAEKVEKTAEEARRTIELIEKANRRLEEENDTLRTRVQDLEALAIENNELKKQAGDLRKDYDASISKLAALEQTTEQKAAEYKEKIEKIRAGHKEELEKLKLAHKAESERLRLEHEREKFEIEKALTNAADELKAKKDSEIDGLKNRVYELETEKNKLVEELLKLRANKKAAPKK